MNRDDRLTNLRSRCWNKIWQLKDEISVIENRLVIIEAMESEILASHLNREDSNTATP